MDKKQKLQELLRTATDLQKIFESVEFQRSLLPYLEKLSHPQPVNPHDCKDRPEYEFKIDNTNREAYVYETFLKFLKNQKGTMQKIQKQLKQEELVYGIK